MMSTDPRDTWGMTASQASPNPVRRGEYLYVLKLELLTVGERPHSKTAGHN